MKPARKMNSADEINLRLLGQMDYATTFRAMQRFTETRTPQTLDEIWLLQHAPVFTMGLKGRHGALTEIHGIPVVYSDRGGDMTYHGPGQLVAYILMDLQRRDWGAKRLVRALEQSVINLLASHQIRGEQRAHAPGVYVTAGKIASLGLRIRKGASYHGISFNLHMDLTPFSYIDPCGYAGQAMTQLFDLGIHRDIANLGQDWLKQLLNELGYTARLIASNLPD